MILLFLLGARCHYHHDIIGAQWGKRMIPLYDIIVSLFLGGFFPRRGPSSSSRRPPSLGTTVLVRFIVDRLGKGGGGVVPYVVLCIHYNSKFGNG